MGATMSGFKLDDDSSEEDWDAIPHYMKAYYPMRIDKKRKKVMTWRDEGLGFWTAFFQGKMRSNDYSMMWSLFIMSALIIAYGATAAALTDKLLGIMYGITVLHVIVLCISLLGNIVANRPQVLWERILTVGSFVLIYVAGIVYLVLAYDVSLLFKDDAELATL